MRQISVKPLKAWGTEDCKIFQMSACTSLALTKTEKATLGHFHGKCFPATPVA